MKTIHGLSLAALLPCVLLVAAGCSNTSGPSSEGKNVLLNEEPSGFTNIVDFKASLATGTGLTTGGDAIIIGRVGSGTVEPWDETAATFLLRDMNLQSEAHDHAGGDHADNCKFCQAEKAKELASMALVRVVDENGDVFDTGAKGLLGLKEDQIVIAQGQGVIDDDGAFVFDAAKIFIRQ